MSDAELDEGTPITLEDAAYVARDGIILLECVNGIDDARAGRGELTVHTDTGSFNLRVDLPTEQSPAKLRENHGGVWGEYPAYPANDWRLERSEERSVGKECGSTFRSRGSPYHSKTKKRRTQQY